MPEGDTLWQVAAKLQAALAGDRVLRFSSPLPELKEQELEGKRVVRARAHGKYAIIEFDDGRALLSHLRMQGRWLVMQKAQLAPDRLARLTREPRWDDERTTLKLETESALAILEHAAIAELAPLAEIERKLSTLGPDLLSESFDLEEACALLRGSPELTIAEALLRQSLVAGAGNVYKSEVLFLEKVSPFSAVGELDDATVARILRRARELLRRNRRGPRRTTGSFAGTPYYVYERSGEHCLKCDTTIQMRRQGALQRSTYYCPECQGVRER
ncbi:MAG TPA: DNA-formamidopyrimidine glycosylase family protein [Polyangiaceae bacterium]|nr:DNA-formamidopyrimidine glycosylase family protein [Polyangiaceae bacterium]